MEEIVTTIALTMGASFCAGINLYATVFVLGALARWSSFDLPPGLEVLMSDWVLWPALFMYVLEFVADKVPAVDTAWDSVHSFIRIPAAALIASQGLGDVPLELEIFAGLIGGSMATMSHVTKASTRVAAHATGTSPVVTPVASVVEDVAVIGTMSFVAANPVLSLVILFFMLILTLYMMSVMWKIVKSIFKGIFSLFKPRQEEELVAAA